MTVRNHNQHASGADLFDGPSTSPDQYPHYPGAKGDSSTSKLAARRIATHAKTIRGKVLGEYLAIFPAGLAPDEMAARLRGSILTIRPRCSELIADGMLEQLPITSINQSGHSARRLRASAKALQLCEVA